MFSCSFSSVIAHIPVINLNFGEDPFFFFLEITWIWAEKSFEFPISAEKSLSISVKTFFFLEITWIWAERSFEFPISAEKSLSISVKTAEFLRVWPPPIKNPGYAYAPNICLS